MIELGHILYIVPPAFAGGTANPDKKKRLLLVISINAQDNTLTLINISKIRDKPRCFTYPCNCLISNYCPPLPEPSFAKLNDTYIIENFYELSNYFYKQGQKLDHGELINIISRRNNYMSKNSIEQVSFNKLEILSVN